MEQTQKMTQDHTARLRKGAFVLIAVIAALYVFAVDDTVGEPSDRAVFELAFR